MSQDKVQETTDNDTVHEASINKTARLQKMNKTYLIAAAVGIVSIVLVGLGVYFFSQPRTALGVAEVTVKSRLNDVIDTMDFSRVTQAEPLAFIDTNRFETALTNLTSLKGLVQSPDVAGKTVHTMGKFTIDQEAGLPANSLNSMDVSFDMYIAYSEDYNSEKYEVSDLSKISDIFSKLTPQEIADIVQKVHLTIDYNLNAGSESTGGRMQLIMVNYDFYITFSNLTGVVSPDLKEMENKVIRADVSEYSNTFFSSLLETINQSGALSIYESADPELVTAQIQQFNDVLAQSITEQDVQLLQRVGNPIRDVVKNHINNTDLFINESAVTMIKPINAVSCSGADINFRGIVSSGFSAANEIASILVNDQAYQGELTLEEINTQLNQSSEYVDSQLDTTNPSVNIRVCNDAQLIRGLGMTFSLGSPKLNISFDLVDESYDSNFVIERPTNVDIDYTEQIKQQLDTIDFESLFNINPYSIGVDPQGSSYYINQEEQISEAELMEMSDSIGKYAEEYQTLYERYIAGEITEAELASAEAALQEKYGIKY